MQDKSEGKEDMKGGACKDDRLRFEIESGFGECCFYSITAGSWKFPDKIQGEREGIENPYQRANNEVMRVDGLTQGKKKASRKRKPRGKTKGDACVSWWVKSQQHRHRV